MSTTKQDKAFAELMKGEIEVIIDFTSAACDAAVDFVRDNFAPEDIFSEKELSYWAEANGYIKE